MVSTPANSINEGGASGLMTFDGTATFSTQALTQYYVVSGASANTINNIAPSTSGYVLTSNGASSQPTFQAPSGSSNLTVTSVAHGASPYTVLSTDQFLAVDVSGGVVTIKLPNAPSTGRVIYIKDSKAAAATSNISVTTVGGTVTIDGQTTYTMATNYQAISVVFDGTNYEVF